MEEVIKTFETLQIKAANAKDALTVLPHKASCLGALSKLTENKNEVKKLEDALKSSLENHQSVLKKQHDETMKTMTRVQLKMVYLMQRLEEQERHKQNEGRTLQSLIPGTPKLLDRAGAAQAFAETNTPRMFVSDYAKSPFAKKRSKVQLQFADFEAEITQEDFKSIPSYMKGRTSLSELQHFLDSVVIRTFTDKYRTLYLHRSALKPSEFNLQNLFKSQASYFEGQKFITVGDIARIIEKNVDKKDDRHLQMLRHLQIIREARKNTTQCYIWLR